MSDDESVSYYSEEDFFGSDEEEENKPAPKKTKKAAPKKAAAKKKAAPKKKAVAKADPMDMDVDEEESSPVLSGNGAKSKKGKKKTVEETYQKKSQLEHILLRPDTYIGSVERVTQPMYVLNDQDRIVEREITYTPGLYKIFDEIVVNAADNKERDSNMSLIEVVVDPEINQVSVKNNGNGIPVVLHKDHNIYVPTLIFGHLLTGSNFDDDEKKTTGGRNGYGAKLANVFSTEFIVECVDVNEGLKFRQVFRSNMEIAEKPVIVPTTPSEQKRGDYVKISFSPDLPRFGMTHLDADTVGLMSKRAYDIAGTMAPRGGKRLVVSLNGQTLKIKSFKDYLGMFDGINEPVAYAKIGDKWEVGVSSSEDASMKQISFVNAICTSKGGGHVTYIADQVAKHLVAIVKKKNKGGLEIKPAQIKNHLTIFVNCLVENPTFDSQTKDFLTTKPKNFGTECMLPPDFVKQIGKSSVIDTILSYARHKQSLALKRRGGVKKSKLTGIVKLDDANNAGTAKSMDCTLIVTEGDSAKSLAMSGLSVVGRDKYGVFPLKGKPLNVRDATHKAVVNNEEIKNVVDIMGLKYGTVYDKTNIKTLRYGHLMIMADQDTDGSHIKGLIINFIHNFWPSLLDIPGFLQQFITPIVKVTKGKKSKTFFNLPEYDNWLESTGTNGKGWTLKYYKGLGTSTSAEAKDYFSHLSTHEVHFAKLSDDKVVPFEDEDDDLAAVLPDAVSSGSDLIDMVFRKTRVEDRKQWLNSLDKDTYLDYSQAGSEGVKYSDFINKEYVLFSNYDNQRSIPHVIDGMKPSQRKVLFGCIKRKLRGEIKVAQLVGYVAEHSAYHHGEASLQGTIVNMAQNFTGSNNVNLLTPSGQFGTRRMGGKDSASPRYIFTKLEPVARAIFHPDDDALLSYLNDDGASIEPDFYVPVIPMVLVNGADGIGTGWSTTVQNYNPREILANLRRQIAGEPLEPMIPSYHGFTGEIIPETGKRAGSYIVKGKVERTNDTTLVISELPIKKWTQDYKVFLEELLSGTEKKKPEIKDFKENHTDTTVAFTIIADKEKIDEFEQDKKGLDGRLKLTGTMSTSNMTLFNTDSRLVRYDTPEDIFAVFYDVRMDFYVKRKNLLVSNLRSDQIKLSNKARFVEEVCAGELVVSNRKRTEILHELQERGYATFQKDVKSTDEDEEDAVDTSSDADLAKGYEYLLGMKIWSLTFEKAQELRSQLEEKTQALEVLEGTSPSEIWLNDLDAIEVALDDRDAAMAEDAADEKKAQKKSKKDQAKKNAQKKKGGKKKGKNDWDSDMESSSDEGGNDGDSDSDMEVEVAPKKAARKVIKAARPAAKKLPAIKPPAPKLAATQRSVLETFKPKASTKAAVKAAPKPAPEPSKAESNDCDSDSDDDGMLGLSLSQRLKKNCHVSPVKKASGSRAKKTTMTMINFDDSMETDSLAELDANSFKPAPLSTVKKPAVKAKKPAAAKKTTVKRGTAATKKMPKTLDLTSDSDSSEDDFEFNSDAEENVVKKPVAARARAGRTLAKRSYVFSDGDDDDDESCFSD